MAGEVTAGLAESNGSLPPGGWLTVTCRLTACTPGSAPGPTPGVEYGIAFTFTFTDAYQHVRVNGHCPCEDELAGSWSTSFTRELLGIWTHKLFTCFEFCNSTLVTLMNCGQTAGRIDLAFETRLRMATLHKVEGEYFPKYGHFPKTIHQTWDLAIFGFFIPPNELWN